MSKENEAVARRLIDEVWNRGNLKLLDELFTSDHVNHDPVNPAQGLEASRNVVAKYRTAFPDCRLDLEDIFSVDDKVAVRWRYSGTHRGQLEGIQPTGRHATGQGISILRFQGNRVRESFTSWDALDMMQQLGVITLPGKSTKAGS
jgi:steroid delta-isomerase-like uncharacterized protein